tara:strand:+ start:4879 stop:5109 length:231 start_codon:yes stop_codon:yes gene_type:complete
MHWTNGFGGGWMMMFWWILIIVAIFGLFRLINNNNTSNSVKEESALDVLEKRYAKGEIDKSEFEQKKEDLTKRGNL